MPTYFFAATEGAHAQITKLFDFVWPTAAAMWNLRWQVGGYVLVVPNATEAQLQSRFTEGADIHGANLRRACITHTWDEQKEAFGRILLANSIAVYEGWIDEILDVLGKNTLALNKALQYPNASAKAGEGAAWAIAEITKVESSILRNSFYSVLCRRHYCALPNLDPMLLCFRFFKELRNCYMHGGGIADQRLVDTYNQFSAVANPATLGVSEVPVHFPPVVGSEAKLSLRGVVGFSNLVLKLIATLDAELSRSELAERSFTKKWILANPHRLTLSTDPMRRERKVKRLVKRAGFPEPAAPTNLCAWLNKKGFVNY